MATVLPTDCVVSTITQYELYTGVEKLANSAAERAKVELLCTSIVVREFDESAAKTAALVRATLERQGTPIGPYDTLLAGHALSAGLAIVTANESEFRRVMGLRVENWQV